MKHYLVAAAIAAVVFTSPAHSADVGVSVSVGQPGFYGRIDIGDYPQPQVIYSQPRVIEVVPEERAPIYLRVPPGHRRHWSQHCREYDACGERVYFVQDGWYNRDYAPRYREQHGEGRHDDRGDEGHGGNDHGDRGNGNHGNGHGKRH